MIDPFAVGAEEHVPIELTLRDALRSQVLIQRIFALKNATVGALEETFALRPSPLGLLNRRLPALQDPLDL